MKTKFRFNPAWLALAALALSSMACLFVTDEGVNVDEPPPVQQPTATIAPVEEPETPQGFGLSSQKRQKLISATVRLLAMFPDGNDYSPQWSGSGTIISPDGFILTNAHVAKPSMFGTGEEDPAFLAVGIVEQEDKPPIYSYVAEVVSADGFLDLAVIRITSTLDGDSVNTSRLDLPFVKIGDSDDVHVGDHINIFGFPGIGGETITFTDGNISGFVSEDQVGDRAWIKTDATIAGGNSGGLAANDNGEIIGVPTIASSGVESGRITDCRVVQDTNGDGNLDENDTCIPIGGFINGLRPVNLAGPLILAGQNEQEYVSPYQIAGGNQIGSEPGSGQETFSNLTWVTLDKKGNPDKEVSSYQSGTETIAVAFDYSGMTDGQTWAQLWYYEGEEIGRGVFAWEFGDQGSTYANLYNTDGSALDDGNYTVELYAGTGEDIPMLADSSIVIGGGGGNVQPVGDDGVLLLGQIVDNDTKRPIKGAFVVILNPGVSFDAWQADSFPDASVYAATETDGKGYFEMPLRMERNTAYTVVIAAEGYEHLVYEDQEFTDDDPAEFEVTIPLSK